MPTGSGELQRIEELFHAALAVDGEERDALLRDQPTAIREEVRALLEEDRRGPIVSRAVRGVASSLAADRNFSSPIGTRIGAYEVIKELGSGGMGSVYLGVRADDTYQRQVAIKFVRAEFDTVTFRERFRHERWILGRLDHANIARLLDAGSTASGQPYFIMEYVDGEAITHYARKHALPRAARLAMFTKVCDAVQYAHQNLIVHRDLKPGNVLVDSFGNPKLLDFGIAKLVGEGGSTDQTVAAGLRILTPDYASPEHAAGLPVTTASDVYSLGAVLFELLLDQRPRPLLEDQSEITPPAGLGSDLGGIVRKAMHRQPEQRYASASELREDVLRFLSGRPLRARSYSMPERTLQFVRRYRGFLAASLAVTCGLAGAAAISLRSAQKAEEARQEAVWERNRAETERQRAEAALRMAEAARFDAIRHAGEAGAQKTVALQERNLAHDRFNEQRLLLGNFIDEVQDKIEGLPGAAPAREQSLTLARAYLERMARDRDAGPAVMRSLALAYLRLADLRGGPTAPSQQADPKAALELHQKAAAILEKPEMLRDPESLALLVRLRSRQAELVLYFGDRPKAKQLLEDGIQKGRKLVAESTVANTEVAVPLIRVLNTAALQAVQFRELESALALASECSGLAAKSSQTPVVVDYLASCITMEGRAHWLSAHLEAAVTSFRRAIKIREDWLLQQPANNVNRRSLMLAYSHLAGVFHSNGRPSMGDLSKALDAFQHVRDHALGISQADPSDRLGQRDLAIATNRYGDLLYSAKQSQKGLELFLESTEVLEQLIRQTPVDSSLRNELLFAWTRVAEILSELPGKSDGVEPAMRKAVAAAAELAGFSSLSDSVFLNMSAAYLHLARSIRERDPAEAAKLHQQGLDLFLTAKKKYPSSPELAPFEKKEFNADAAGGVPKSH